MTLTEWCTAHGTGARNALHLATGLSLPAIDRALQGRSLKETAELIAKATGGRVPVASMMRARTKGKTKVKPVARPPTKRGRRGVAA
jgi:hypothetical protein